MNSRRHSAGGKQGSNLTLQQIFYEVPRLLQFICTTDLRAILFTSRGLRQCLVDYVTSIKAPTAGLQLLVDHKWPLLLQKLNLCISEDVADPDKGLHALAGIQWPTLAVLDLSNLCLGARAIQDLGSAHLPSLTAVNLAGNKLVEDAIKGLVKASWPRLEMLDLSSQDYLSHFDSRAAAYLVKGEWPLLKTLNLSDNNVCIGQLLNGNWPALQVLDLSDMFYDEDAPAIVKDTAGLAWPSLKRLNLSDGAIDDLGVAELTLAEWPCLEFVCLACMSAEKVAEIFASCEWPALSHLELREVNTGDKGALMCTTLSKVHLPVLEMLVIHDFELGTVAMAELVKAAWELLRHVSFFRFLIGAAGVMQLVQANWRNLHVLNIACGALNFEAVSELSRGQWPLLDSLSLCESKRCLWPTVSVKRLLDGTWPVLSELVLSPSDCEAAAFLLSGSTELRTICGSDHYFYPWNKVSKTVTGCGPDQWPRLKFSTFVLQA